MCLLPSDDPRQRNLLKRIARGETIDDTYIASTAQAIVDSNVVLEVPELAVADLPTGSAGGATIQLRSIGELKFVNALLDDVQYEIMKLAVERELNKR